MITESNPLVSSSVAKEESLEDMMKVMSKYANVIVCGIPMTRKLAASAGFSEAPGY